MIVEVLIFLAAISSMTLIAVIGHVLFIMARNYKAHQFFRIKSPKLKLVPSKYYGIFGGHAGDLAYGPLNYKIIDELLTKDGPYLGAYYCDKPVVFTTDLKLIKTMVVDEPDDHLNRIDLNLPIKEFDKHCIISAKDGEWKRIRKALAPAFASHKVRSANVQAEIFEVIDEFVSSIECKLEQASSKHGVGFIVEDADNIFHRFALALVFTCFYKQKNVIDFFGKTDSWQTCVDSATKEFNGIPLKMCVKFPILKPLIDLAIKWSHPLGIARVEIMRFIRMQTKLNLEAKKQFNKSLNGASKGSRENFLMEDGSRFRKNMIDYVTDRFHDGQLTEEEYYNNNFFLFISANKDTSDAMSKFIFFIARHENVQKKLRESILIEGQESKYLTWCIKESLRLLPPAPIGCSRIITRDYYTDEGLLIPANTFVITPAFTINRLKRYWGPDADEFNPDRWADTNKTNLNPVQFLSFGAGKRSCPGKEFVLEAMHMLYNKLLSRFKFELCPETTESSVFLFDNPALFFTTPHLPTNVRISRVK